MNRRAACLLSVALIAAASWTGCGASNKDCIVSNHVTPVAATADHTQLAPANQVQFLATRTVSGPCAIPAVMPVGTWTTSDTVNTSIDASSGLATCKAATSTAATISFTSQNPAEVFPAATLSCR